MIRNVPRYALYGEAQLPSLPERMHFESIEERSQLHGWEILPHVHSNLYQLLWLRGGRCDALLGGQPLQVQASRVLLVPELIEHGFKFSPKADGAVFTLVPQVVEETFQGSLGLLQRMRRPQVVDVSAHPTLTHTLNALVQEYVGVEAGRLEAVHTVLSYALVQLARLAQADADGDIESGRRRSEQHGAAFKKLVETHYRQTRDLGFYAETLSLSMTQLHRVCRTEFGMAPLEMIHARLQVEAERELVYTALSIKEIALLLGFQDPAYFSRFFSKRLGCAPQAYRARVDAR